jgi:putative iron-dependent peroxidase
MSGAQDVTASPGKCAIIIVFAIRDYKKAKPKIIDLCGRLEALVRSELNRFPDAQTGTVIAFGATAWRKLFKGWPVPEELTTFEPIQGEKHLAPSTPGDLFFHIRSSRMDVCQELAAIISQSLDGVVDSIDETHGFRNFDGRAMVGFVDGTENPTGDDSALFGSIASDSEKTGKADFSGGSYIFIQKYLHDMKAWEALTVEEQEKAIGRRKYNDLELTDEVKPENAHNAVTNIKGDQGEELKIVRANIPFANASKGEYGTYFLGYAGKFSTTKRMLENMFKGDPPGNTDRLLDFSKAVTGTLFFAPSAEYLASLAEEA